MKPKGWQWLEDALLDDNILYRSPHSREERIFWETDDGNFLRDYLGELPPVTGEPGDEDWRDADEVEDD